jgi:hypothetical protein
MSPSLSELNGLLPKRFFLTLFSWVGENRDQVVISHRDVIFRPSRSSRWISQARLVALVGDLW